MGAVGAIIGYFVMRDYKSKDQSIFIFFPLILLIFPLGYYSLKKFKEYTHISMSVASDLPATHRLGKSAAHDENEIEIHGESHYQDNLVKLFGAYTVDGHDESCQALLMREPSNHYDRNAIKCLINGLLVGYVNRDDAEVISSVLDKSGIKEITVGCTVRGGWKNDKEIGMYGVVVSIPKRFL